MLTVCMSVLYWKVSDMVRWCCLRGLGGVGGRGVFGQLRAPEHVSLKNRAFTRSPPIHLLIPVTLHPCISNTQNETPPSCFIHPLSVFYSVTWLPTLVGFLLLFSPSVSACLSCLALYKEKLFFLVSVRQSICLSVFVRVAIFPAVWLQVEKWGHPVGDLISWIPEGWSPSPCSKRT